MDLLIMIKKILTMIGKPAYRLSVWIIKNIKNVKTPKVKLPKIKINWPKWKPRIQWGYLTASLILLVVSLGMMWTYFNVFKDLPNVNEIYNPPRLSTKILDRNGVLLYKFYEDENRTWITIDKIPQSLIWATLAIEDKDFYKHHGISLTGIVNAMIYNIFKKGDGDSIRGGSTITQQLVKKVFFSDEKTYIRKIKEVVMALLLESKLSKDEIFPVFLSNKSRPLPVPIQIVPWLS